MRSRESNDAVREAYEGMARSRKQAAEAERAAIVAWLRDAAKRGEIPVIAASLSLSANAIESGVHLNAEQVTR